MFTEAFEALLRDHCTPAAVRVIESGGAHALLWDVITDSGFLELMASEDAGGAGQDLAVALPILRLLGAHAMPLPVGQAIALRTLLPAGETVPKGMPTFAPALTRGADGSLQAPRVPFGALADHVVGELDGELLLLDAAEAQRRSLGIHHDATADLTWNAAVARRAGRVLSGAAPAGSLAAWGAALHAALLAGALARSFELALQYGNDRVQFGKPIGKFQAIQHQLAVMAEHVAAAQMAAAGAFSAGRTIPASLPAAVAKARGSEAVTVVAPIAHAVHGAIGVTDEYDLQLFTRRLHGWRMAHGSEAYWHRVIGEQLLADSEPVSRFIRMI
ncbi:acyl-CoA dehydrogenase family protein [Bradyrhizobium sp. 2TAF24]|uniref:acyl-CoA dehydrogenase family protein n=1 Tax=Bradyrhizobium sp. 2TAF24 TaxID=3233011 RepID=UPI003F910141